MSEADLRKHHRVLHKRLQRGRPLDQFRRRAALVKETSDEADRRGWCTRAGACAVSPMCGGPRSTPLRLRESQTTLDAPVERNASRGLSSPSRLCERPCQVGDDLVQCRTMSRIMSGKSSARRCRKGDNARQGGSTVASVAAVHDVAARCWLLRA